MYSDVQCMVLIWLSRQESHAQPPLDPSGSGLPEGFHCFPAHIWGTYGDHLPNPSNSINFAQYPSYPSFSLGDTVVCGFFCRFQLWCSVSRVETVVQQPAQQKEASRSSSRPFAVPKRCQDASWGRKQCISQLAPDRFRSHGPHEKYPKERNRSILFKVFSWNHWISNFCLSFLIKWWGRLVFTERDGVL